MQGTIHQVQRSQSGKSFSVTVDGQRFSAKISSGLDAHVGKRITFDPTPQTFNDGKTINWINQFTLSDSAPGPSVSQAASGASNGAGVPSHYQPMVSNLAASLIAAGKGPEDLNGWFQECKRVLEGKSEDAPF